MDVNRADYLDGNLRKLRSLYAMKDDGDESRQEKILCSIWCHIASSKIKIRGKTILDDFPLLKNFSLPNTLKYWFVLRLYTLPNDSYKLLLGIRTIYNIQKVKIKTLTSVLWTKVGYSFLLSLVWLQINKFDSRFIPNFLNAILVRKRDAADNWLLGITMMNKN